MRINSSSFSLNEAMALYSEPSSRVSMSGDGENHDADKGQGDDEASVLDQISPTLLRDAVSVVSQVEVDVENEADADPELTKDLSSLTEPKGSDGEPLSEEEQQQIEELEQRDREVKAHEQAHMAALGSYATGAPTYEYQEGPDGEQYAIGGHVNFSVSPGSTSEETISKGEQIKRAALAPADPSSTDMSVAMQASAMEMEAQSELSDVSEDEDRLSDAKDVEGASLTFGGKGAIDSLEKASSEEDSEEANSVQKAYEPVLSPTHVADAVYQAQNLLQAPELISYA